METIKRKIHPVRKGKRVRTSFVADDNVVAEVLRFVEYHPAERFKRNLRKMLLEFLMSDDAVENFYLRDLLYDLEGLFELLDAIQAAKRQEI